jgi:hypothetical protein
LKNFHKLSRKGKPLYVEAYKIMAASNEVIKMKFGDSLGPNMETAFFSCIQDMIETKIKTMGIQDAKKVTNIESLAYCYSAVISMLSHGVVSHKEKDIIRISLQLINSEKFPAMAKKYAIICLQYVLHSKSENQWNTEQNVQGILETILKMCVNTQKEII